MNKPDDGGPYFPETYTDDLGELRNTGGASIRAEFAKTFAAAWLPILSRDGGNTALYQSANHLGLAQADDLIRRLRENQA